MATTFILTKEFAGQTKALMEYTGFDTTSLVLWPITDEYLLSSNNTKPKLLTFNSAAEAISAAAKIDSDVTAGHVGSGVTYFEHGVKKEDYQNLTPAQLDVNISVLPYGQRGLI